MAENDAPVRPIPQHLAPDAANVYERAKPENESGMGRLDNNISTPTKSPDEIHQAVTQKQGLRQLNADDDVVSNRAQSVAGGSRTDAPRPDGSDIKNE